MGACGLGRSPSTCALSAGPVPLGEQHTWRFAAHTGVSLSYLYVWPSVSPAIFPVVPVTPAAVPGAVHVNSHGHPPRRRHGWASPASCPPSGTKRVPGHDNAQHQRAPWTSPSFVLHSAPSPVALYCVFVLASIGEADAHGPLGVSQSL